MPSLIIDGTDLPVWRPPIPDEIKGDPEAEFYYLQNWFSFKLRTYAIKYEIGVHVLTGKIVWIYGPKRGAVHDGRLTRERLLKVLPKGERALADRGYSGVPGCLTPMKGRRNATDKRLDDIRRKVERVIGRIKFFNILYREYRGNLDLHPAIFDVVCRIVNINLKDQPIRKLPKREFADD